jgi:hypothetical protein
LYIDATIGAVARIGIVNVAIRFHDLLRPDDLDANLILGGGPDANQLSREFFNLNMPTFGWPSSSLPVVSLMDQRDDVYYHPQLDQSGTAGKDYGVIVRGSNPVHPDRDALLLAGCWGFGTWASAGMAFLPQLNAQQFVQNGQHFEALVGTDVQADSLTEVDLLEVRLIDPPRQVTRTRRQCK